MRRKDAVSAAIAAGLLLTTSSTAALAGGFAIREQSTLFQGLAFAGSAAGGALSSIYWNSAATAAIDGTNTDSNFALLIGRAEVKVDEATGNSQTAPGLNPVITDFFTGADSDSGNISSPALISASYGNTQLSDKLYIGFGSNAPFGLKTEPENEEYAGSPLGRKTSLFTLNANPTLAYKLTPFLTVGAGVQIQYADAIFKFASALPQADTTTFSQDDWAFGATAGVILQPTTGTSIGLGWRSQMTHQFEGRLSRNATGAIPAPTLPLVFPGAPELSIGAEAELDLPDIVTLSLRTAVSPTMRLMGTVEWTNWSRFENLTLNATEAGINPVSNTAVAAGDALAVIEADWDDGWFFSVGGEFDYSDRLTLRGGLAYEISPVDSPEKRIVSIPDADRVWLSLGASYDYSASTILDFSYTHIFIQDERFERSTLSPLLQADLAGTVEAEADIVSVGMRTKW